MSNYIFHTVISGENRMLEKRNNKVTFQKLLSNARKSLLSQRAQLNMFYKKEF